MDEKQAMAALRATGETLSRELPDGPVINLYVVGGVAGMVRGELAEDRTTVDCDVMRVEPGEVWDAVASAAQVVGEAMGLKDHWLNRECKVFGWQMPLGWTGRCHHLGSFGKLRVWVLSRGDLIASKVMGAPKRVQDRDDLRTMRPTAAELDEVLAHLDHVETQTQPGECDAQRKIVEWLRNFP